MAVEPVSPGRLHRLFNALPRSSGGEDRGDSTLQVTLYDLVDLPQADQDGGSRR
jgi:hypothetical protein